MSDIPRSEYPRPQFVRDDWLCLNGEWGFEVDQGDSGIHRGLLERELSDKITVPFCPESQLSGIENHDYYNAVWYRRSATIPAGWGGQARPATLPGRGLRQHGLGQRRGSWAASRRILTLQL